MQDEKSRPAIVGVKLREAGDLGPRVDQKRLVPLVALHVGVGPVAQQREVKLAPGMRQVVDLEGPDELVDRIERIDEAWHHDQRATVVRHAILELVADEARRPRGRGDQGIEDRRCHLARRQRRQQGQDRRRRRPRAQPDQRKEHHAEGNDGDAEHRCGNSDPPEAAIGPREAHRDRETAPQVGLKADPGLPCECRADVHTGGIASLQRPFRHRRLGLAGPARHLLDGAAILVLRGEIEFVEVGAGAQHRIDPAHRGEPVLPVDVIERLKPADDVADAHVACGEPVLLGDLDFVVAAAARLEMHIDPGDRLARPDRLLAEAIEQLAGKGIVAGIEFVGLQQVQPLVGGPGREQNVRQLVGAIPQQARAVDAPGNAREIVQQHETHHGRHRPELADPKRSAELETVDQRAQPLPRDLAA